MCVCLCVCVRVSVLWVSIIPLLYEWVHLHRGVMVFQPLESILLWLLDSRWLLQVCTAAKMRSDIGDKIIHAYVPLPFDMIPTSTPITYIWMNREGHIITRIQSDRRLIHCLACNTRGNYRKGAELLIEYYPVEWEYNLRYVVALQHEPCTQLSSPPKSFSDFRICGFQPRV